jgi:hypothetical protein
MCDMLKAPTQEEGTVPMLVHHCLNALAGVGDLVLSASQQFHYYSGFLPSNSIQHCRHGALKTYKKSKYVSSSLFT